MISFVWSAKYPFISGAGGSENYTAGQIRELQRRGVPARIVTLGHGRNDGRDHFPDIEFRAIHSKEQLSLLNDTLVFVTYPLYVRTKKPSFAILHCPPFSAGLNDPLFDRRGLRGKHLIAASRFAATTWEHDLNLQRGSVDIVYPFADEAFRMVKRPPYLGRKSRILFGGRLHPDKGIYTLLASLHVMQKMRLPAEVTVTTAGTHDSDGQVIHSILQAHPWVRITPAGRSTAEVAELMANHDIVVMPSTDILWKENFGMLSVEAQHAGCRVVASNAGGLPETDCGGLILTEPDNPKTLAEAIQRAVKFGPLTSRERRRAANVYTVEESVEVLLDTIRRRTETPATRPVLRPVRFAETLHTDYFAEVS
jgi:D-inositol-3-phosphate glycosyltransferase